MSTAETVAAMIQAERLAGDDPADGSRLIGGLVDLPIDATVSPLAAAPANPANGAQLITGHGPVHLTSVTPNAGPTGGSAEPEAPTAHAIYSPEHVAPDGSSANSGAAAVIAAAEPVILGGGGSPLDPAPVVSAPVNPPVIANAIASAEGARGAGETGSVAESVLHQLVAAMAGFGGADASPLTSAIAQSEVDGARVMLAAGLHYSL
jgi:hypothetical protein